MDSNASISMPMETEQQWFAFSVRSRHEKSVGAQLQDKLETLFLPLVRQQRRWANRLTYVDMPLLPGYIFCRSHRFGLLPILKTPGIIDVLRAGATPVPVPQEEIEALQTVIAAKVLLEACPLIILGQTVRIEKGALAGLSGIVVEIKNAKRLVLSVTLLQRSVLVQLEPGYLRTI